MNATGDELLGRWVVHDILLLARAGKAVVDRLRTTGRRGGSQGAAGSRLEAARTEDRQPAPFGFPIMLEVRGQRVAILGGGREPADKAAALANLGALVAIWASEHRETATLRDDARIDLRDGPFDPAIFEGARLAIIATGDRAFDRAAATDARARGVLVNTVDDIPFCDWSAPAILRRGDLTVSFATAGIAPALAVRLRDRYAEQVGPEYGELLDQFGQIRPRIMASGRSFASRRTLWYSLVDGPAYELLRQGDAVGARAALLDAVTAWEATP